MGNGITANVEKIRDQFNADLIAREQRNESLTAKDVIGIAINAAKDNEGDFAALRDDMLLACEARGVDSAEISQAINALTDGRDTDRREPADLVFTLADFYAASTANDAARTFNSSLLGGAGLPNGALCYIGARTGRGKTTTLINIAREALFGTDPRRVFFWTFEELPSQITRKLILSGIYELAASGNDVAAYLLDIAGRMNGKGATIAFYDQKRKTPLLDPPGGKAERKSKEKPRRFAFRKSKKYADCCLFSLDANAEKQAKSKTEKQRRYLAFPD